MKDPAFLLYSSDFSIGTQFLTDEQVGKYVRLLMAQHQHGHLPENHMIYICKSYDKDVFNKFKKDEEGMYYNERLEFEINRRKKYSQSRSDNKKGHTKALKEDLTVKSQKSYDNHMETETVTVNRNVIDYSFIDKKEFFEIFKRWADYKAARKEKYKTTDSLAAAYKKLIKLSSGNIAEAMEIIEDAIANNYAGFFPLKNKPGFSQAPEKNKLTTLMESANRVTLKLDRE